MTGRSNIIFIFSDQQRWDTVGCYGQSLPVTPNLDQMAQEGVRMEHAFTCQPVCGPARAALQTGKYPTEVGCHRNHQHLPADCDTLAKQMRAAGYRTGYIGKWHLASGANPLVPDENPDCRWTPVPPHLRGGYDDWLASDVLEFTSHGYDGHMFDGEGCKRKFPEGRYRVDAQTDWVLDYLDERPTDEPFFLFVSYIEPHHQNDHDCYEGPDGSRERWGNYEVPGDLVGHDGNWEENYPDYLGCCNALDGAVGRIRAKLAEKGIADDTVVIYTSDHGSHFRTRNSEYKRACHEACLRIPMIACGPGFAGGSVYEGLTSLMDIPRTLLKAAGADIPADWQGISLQDQLAGTQAHDEVFAQISEAETGRCIRTHRWKYSVRGVTERVGDFVAPGAAVYHEEFLYDLEKDPHEQVNLVDCDQHAPVRAELARLVKKAMAEAHEPVPEILPATQWPQAEESYD
jgi:arylsulfatase A-like enzyme